MLLSFSAAPLRQHNELESAQVFDLLAQGYTPPQSRTLDVGVPSITTDDGSHATITGFSFRESQHSGHYGDSLETLISSPPRIEEDASDGVVAQTILDVLCSRENKPESLGSELPMFTVDSERYMSEEDIFVSRCDNDGINWLENL